MEKINIKDLEIQLDLNQILNVISHEKYFEIDVFGAINFDTKNKIIKPIIFQKKDTYNFSSILDINENLKNIFKNYSFEIIDNIFKLRPLKAWQEIILLNKDRMLYFDHQTDGVEFFEDSILEDIGWNCTPLNINYRELSSFIESNCNGFLVYYDNGAQFNGFVLVDDIKDVRQKVESYVKDKVFKMIKDKLLDLEDDEVLESLEFFKIKV